MAETTIPTPPTLPETQDLQINLTDIPKIEETAQQPAPFNPSEAKSRFSGIRPSTDLNLDLDLNLPEAPKDDDRLKTEDQKNNEVAAVPVVEQIIEPIVTPVAGEPIAEVHPVQEVIEPPVIAQVPAEVQSVTGNLEPVTEIISAPSTTIETETIPTMTATAALKEDMKIINDLEGNTSAGGLAPEAIIVPQPIQAEAPKTFDLDAMLGTPVAASVAAEAPMQMPQAAPPVQIQQPAFTPPAPIQAPRIQTNMPPRKNTGVKVLLFVVMFAALGFTTFFILKTMYPIEFANMFGGGQQINTSATLTDIETLPAETVIPEVTGEMLPTEALSSDQISGTIDTGGGTHESPITTGDSIFGELNDLGIATSQTVEAPAQNDVTRLTDYATQGNDFLAQGKILGNNTIIKYGLYISKKATAFLEDIANGKQINNLSGYFAQFDQYIIKLKELLAQPQVSPPPPANDTQGMTPDSSTATTDTGFTPQ